MASLGLTFTDALNHFDACLGDRAAFLKRMDSDLAPWIFDGLVLWQQAETRAESAFDSYETLRTESDRIADEIGAKCQLITSKS